MLEALTSAEFLGTMLTLALCAGWVQAAGPAVGRWIGRRFFGG